MLVLKVLEPSWDAFDSTKAKWVFVHLPQIYLFLKTNFWQNCSNPKPCATRCERLVLFCKPKGNKAAWEGFSNYLAVMTVICFQHITVYLAKRRPHCGVTARMSD